MLGEVSSFNPAFNWKPMAPGIVITLIQMHGDADIFSTHESRFGRNEAGRMKAGQLLLALEHLNEGIGRNIEASLEDLCAWLDKKTGLGQAVLEDLLDKLVVTDSACEDSMATPVAYTVTETDESGRVLRAQFDNGTKKKVLVGYKSIGQVHSSYLRNWA